MTVLDEYYEKQTEPNRSFLLALRGTTLSYHPQISEIWKYRTPFFYYGKKMLCYLSVDRRT